MTDPHYTAIREDVLSDLGWTEEQAANYSLTELQQILGGDPTGHIRRMLPKVDSVVADTSSIDSRVSNTETSIANIGPRVTTLENTPHPQWFYGTDPDLDAPSAQDGDHFICVSDDEAYNYTPGDTYTKEAGTWVYKSTIDQFGVTESPFKHTYATNMIDGWELGNSGFSISAQVGGANQTRGTNGDGDPTVTFNANAVAGDYIQLASWGYLTPTITALFGAQFINNSTVLANITATLRVETSSDGITWNFVVLNGVNNLPRSKYLATVAGLNNKYTRLLVKLQLNTTVGVAQSITIRELALKPVIGERSWLDLIPATGMNIGAGATYNTGGIRLDPIAATVQLKGELVCTTAKSVGNEIATLPTSLYGFTYRFAPPKTVVLAVPQIGAATTKLATISIDTTGSIKFLSNDTSTGGLAVGQSLILDGVYYSIGLGYYAHL